MINGKQLRDAFISGANNLNNKKIEVDALNVFPVPDGDTGTNMSMTVGNGAKELMNLSDDATVEEVSKTAASAFMRGARGNSGAILSLLFRGFAMGLRGKEFADGADIAHAFSLGVDAAYKAVMKPTEGTILTVARCASEKANEIIQYDNSVSTVFYGMFLQAQKALDETPEMLPILKKSGVVDAGGQGLVYIMEGMWNLMFTGRIVEANETEAEKNAVSAAGTSEQDIRFAYCTESIIDRIPDSKNPDSFKRFLASIGDSLVFIVDESMIKFHVHTNDPGKVLTEALNYGTLTTVKIENMKLQHTSLNGDESAEGKEQTAEEKFPYAEVNPDTAFGFVSVCAGEGLTDIFKDLGCDNVVYGGQTMNPSTEDILAAIQATPAQNVFVLPNNKNIIMVANQAAEIADRNVIVIPSRTVPQGISAMLSYDPDSSAADNTSAMNEALSSVATGQVTFAARDSDFDGHKIKAGEFLAMKEGKMIYTGKDMDTICGRLAKALATKDTSIVTIYYGKDISEEQAEGICEVIKSKLPSSVEVSTVYGGQPIYYFIISAE